MAESRKGAFGAAGNSARGENKPSRVGAADVTDQEFEAFSPEDKIAHIQALTTAKPAPRAARAAEPEEVVTPRGETGGVSRLGDVRAHPTTGQRQVLMKVGRGADWRDQDEPAENAPAGHVLVKGFRRDPATLSAEEASQVKARSAAINAIGVPKSDTKAAAAVSGVDVGSVPTAKAPTPRQAIQQAAAAAGKPLKKPTEVDQAHTNHIAILRGHIAAITSGKMPTGAAYDRVAAAHALLNKADAAIGEGRQLAQNRVESDGQTRRFPQAYNKKLQVAGNLILAAHDSLNSPEVIAHAKDKSPLERKDLESWSEHSNQLPTFSTKGKAPKAFRLYGQKFDFRDPETAMAVAEIHHEVHDLGNPHGIDPELLKTITTGTPRIAPEERDKWRKAGDELAGATVGTAAQAGAAARAEGSTVDARAATAGPSSAADGRPFATSTQPGRPGDSSAALEAEAAAPRAEGASPVAPTPYRPTRKERAAGERPPLISLDREPRTEAAAGRVAEAAAGAAAGRQSEASQAAAGDVAKASDYAKRAEEEAKAGVPVPFLRKSEEEKAALREPVRAASARANSEVGRLDAVRPKKGRGSLNKNTRVVGGEVTRAVDEAKAADLKAKGKKKGRGGRP